MKVLIVADTHGRDNNLLEAVKREKPIEKIVHLGDLNGLEDYIEQITDCVCFAVRGNNDLGSPLPHENIIMMGNHRTFITHGHYYNVSCGVADLIRHARSLECDTIMYGHTHIPEIRKGDITVINPGSLTYPRQAGHLPSYIVATIDEAGNAEYEIKYIQ